MKKVIYQSGTALTGSEILWESSPEKVMNRKCAWGAVSYHVSQLRHSLYFFLLN